ncbi:hypothetical protein ACB098_06G118800 [Castanea mollissima]
MDATSLHLVMYPFFALRHLTPYLHLSNKLAQKGYRISFLIPSKTQSKLGTFKLNPDLITFVPITVPYVDGLPPGAETTSDVPDHLHPLIMTAMDRTESDIELLLHDLKPDIVFFDFTHWLPKLARSLGIRSILYATVSPLIVDYYTMPPAGAEQHTGNNLPEVDLMQPPSSFSVSSSIKLHVHEARAFDAIKTMKFGSDVVFRNRLFTSLSQCDALGLRTCREIEGPYIDNLESHFGKSVFLSGPVIPKPPTSALEEKWIKWLGRFKARSVIYRAFGSECTLNKDQFQELVLGFELSGWPFLAALKPPFGAESIEEASLQEGFEERVQGRGIVHGGWVQQLLILKHPSVGCFITHWCQLVLLPHVGDQILNATMMSNNLKVGEGVEKGEDGLFIKESVCKMV